MFVVDVIETFKFIWPERLVVLREGDKMRVQDMRERSRLFSAALALAGLAVVSGCAGPGAEGQGETAPTASEERVASGSVVFWGWKGVDEVNTQIDAFNEVYPDISVEYKFIDFSVYVSSLRTGLGAGTDGPDVFLLQPGAITAEYGPAGADLEYLAEEALGADWQSQLSEGAVSAFTVDGNLKAVAGGAGGAGTLLVNQTLLESLGLTVPSTSTTLTEWLEMCGVIEAAGTTCFAHGAKDAWVNLDVFRSTANSVSPGTFSRAAAGEVSWEDPQIIEALELWQSFFSNGLMQRGALAAAQYPDVALSYVTQEAAMVAMGTWESAGFIEEVNLAQQSGSGVTEPTPFVSVLTGFPDVAEKGNAVGIFADPDTGMALNPNSDNVDAAELFIIWSTLDPSGGAKVSADALAQVPVLAGVTGEPAGLVDSAAQGASISFITNGVVQSAESRNIPYAELVTAIGDALQAVAAGTQTPSQAAASIEAVSQSITR